MCIAAGYMSGFVWRNICYMWRNIRYMCMILHRHKWETLYVCCSYFRRWIHLAFLYEDKITHGLLACLGDWGVWVRVWEFPQEQVASDWEPCGFWRMGWFWEPVTLRLADVCFGLHFGGRGAGGGSGAHLHQFISGFVLSVSLCIVKLAASACTLL